MTPESAHESLGLAAALFSERQFPIQTYPEFPKGRNRIPWALIAPHEEMAKRNHAGQDLEMLASRGGLCAMEAVAVIEDKPYRERWPYTMQGTEERLVVQGNAIATLEALVRDLRGYLLSPTHMSKREQFIADVRSATTEALFSRLVGFDAIVSPRLVDAKYRALADRAGQDEVSEALGRKNCSYLFEPSDRVKAEAILIFEYNNTHPDEMP